MSLLARLLAPCSGAPHRVLVYLYLGGIYTPTFAVIPVIIYMYCGCLYIYGRDTCVCVRGLSSCSFCLVNDLCNRSVLDLQIQTYIGGQKGAKRSQRVHAACYPARPSWHELDSPLRQHQRVQCPQMSASLLAPPGCPWAPAVPERRRPSKAAAPHCDQLGFQPAAKRNSQAVRVSLRPGAGASRCARASLLHCAAPGRTGGLF